MKLLVDQVALQSFQALSYFQSAAVSIAFGWLRDQCRLVLYM